MYFDLAYCLQIFFFQIFASIQLLALFALWTPSGVVWWRAEGYLFYIICVLYTSSWTLLIKASYEAGAEVQSGALGWMSLAQDKKQDWLKSIIQTKRDDLPDFIESWSDDIYLKSKSFKENTIVFTHFMVINALLSRLAKKNTLMYFYPNYTSVVKVGIKNNAFEYFSTEENKKTSINL